MHFIDLLIKRKDRFGLIWLAAFRPSKLTKFDVLHIDLVDKWYPKKSYRNEWMLRRLSSTKQLLLTHISHYLNDLMSQIANGGNGARLNISLRISSQLMYGLVVILHRKNVYLYDELVHLKNEIFRSYFHEAPQKRVKTPKKVRKVDKQAIALVEEFPVDLGGGLIDITEAKFELAEATLSTLEREERLRNITLDESAAFGGYANSTIHIEYGDFFGDFLEPLVEFEEPSVLPQPLPISEEYEVVLSPPKIAPAKEIISRVPLKELSQNEQTKRAAELMTQQQKQQGLSAIGLIEEASMFIQDFDLAEKENIEVSETVGIQVVEDGVQLPALFQETFLSPTEVQPKPGGVVVEAAEAPHLLNGQIEEIKRAKERKLALTKRIKERKRPAIQTDTVTVISESDMRKRIGKSGEAHRPNSELKNAFHKIYLDAKYDFMNQDLFHLPSASLSRRTVGLTEAEHKMSARSRLVAELKCLTSGKQPDDEYFYLTEARDVRVSGGRVSRRREEVLVEQQEESREFGRYLSESRRLRKASFLDVRERDSFAETLQPVGMMHEPFESLAQPPPPPPAIPEPGLEPLLEASSIRQPFESLHIASETATTTTIVQPQADLDTYEQIIMKTLVASRIPVSLENIIKTEQMTDRCKLAEKPRRMFATKLFMATLTMCKRDLISAEQTESYGEIKLELAY